MTNLELTGICYVLLDVGKAHPITDQRHSLVWYPERAMSMLECVEYRPYVKSVVTENPWIIACYAQENVRVWDAERGWIMPSFQTYGSSVNKITMSLLGVRQTMPSTPYDGGKAIRELREAVAATY